MTSNIEPIRQSTFSDKNWSPVDTFNFAATTSICPIGAEELTSAVMTFPLAFSAGDEGTLVAVLGLGARNLYVAPDGRWIGSYIPAALRAYPFKLLRGEEDTFHLGYDSASNALVELGQGEPFFDAAGQPAERVQNILAFLVQVNRGISRMLNAAKRLREAGLLEPWPLKVRHGDGEQVLPGLMRVNETALNALSDRDFVALRQDGALPVAYAQLLSMTNTSLLAKLAQSHQHHLAMLEKQKTEVSSIFESHNEEEQIDWDAVLKSH